MIPSDELLSLVRAHLEAARGKKRLRVDCVDLRKARRTATRPLFRPPVEVDLSCSEERLIVYGTLAPGRDYHHFLANLPATWEPCTIRGRLGSYRGYPSFKWNPLGEPHPAWLVTSPLLPAKFRDLDRFEGRAYSRRFIPAQAGNRLVIAYIYEGKLVA